MLLTRLALFSVSEALLPPVQQISPLLNLRGNLWFIPDYALQFRFADHSAAAHLGAAQLALCEPRVNCPFADAAQPAGGLFY